MAFVIEPVVAEGVNPMAGMLGELSQRLQFFLRYTVVSTGKEETVGVPLREEPNLDKSEARAIPDPDGGYSRYFVGAELIESAVPIRHFFA